MTNVQHAWEAPKLEQIEMHETAAFKNGGPEVGGDVLSGVNNAFS